MDDVLPHCKPAVTRLSTDLAPFESLCASLHPSLSEPLDMVKNYLANEGKDSGLRFLMLACDLTPLEKNRLKVSLF